jgi:hypothetical protein
MSNKYRAFSPTKVGSELADGIGEPTPFFREVPPLT